MARQRLEQGVVGRRSARTRMGTAAIVLAGRSGHEYAVLISRGAPGRTRLEAGLSVTCQKRKTDR
jgi:hypothetical protein